MVSNMFDQCSRCVKMYHVNIKTSYQITDFEVFVQLEMGSGRASVSCTQDGTGFPSQKDVWTPVCFCEALPACSYVIFPRGAPWAEISHTAQPGEHPFILGLPSQVLLREQLYFQFSTRSCLASGGSGYLGRQW
jgi:hypothetical protein